MNRLVVVRHGGELRRKLLALGFRIGDLYDERGDFGVAVDIMRDIRAHAVGLSVSVVDLREDSGSEAVLGMTGMCKGE